MNERRLWAAAALDGTWRENDYSRLRDAVIANATEGE